MRKGLLWIALSAVAVVLLLGVTNELCLDVASIPFLWVLQLSIYLMGTTCLCFHLGLGLSRLPSTWGYPAGNSRVTRVVAGAFACMIWVASLQLISQFAVGEPLLRTGPEPLRDLARPADPGG